MDSSTPDDVAALDSPHPVRTLSRPFDPRSADAEARYDEVVRRVNRSRAQKVRLGRERDELSRQFVEGDLVVRSGKRSGQPLSKGGRKRRLARLLEVGAALSRVEAEERFATEALDRMNQALDRWARETYGG